MPMSNLSNKIEKAINVLRTVISRIFQRLQLQSEELIHVVFNIRLSKFDIFLILLVLISSFFTLSTDIIPGSGLIIFLLRLLGAVGTLLGGVAVNILSARMDKFFVKRKRSQAKDIQQQNEQISILHIHQRRTFSTILIVLIFLSTMLAVFQWHQAQQKAYEAQTAAATAQAQAKIAQEQEMQAERFSSVNSEIIDMLIESISVPITQSVSVSITRGEKLSEIGDIYQNRGLLDNAIETQNEVLEIYQKVEHLKGQWLILNKIGQLYYSKGQTCFRSPTK